MKRCKHKNLVEKNMISGGYNIPLGTIEEYDIFCKDCGKWLAYWSYGSIVDISKERKRVLGFKIPIHRKIFDYIKNKIQNKKIDIYNNQELPF